MSIDSSGRTDKLEQAVHSKKIQNVCALGPEARFDYFIRKVVDFEEVWGLYDEGWATSELQGSVVIPFWPEEAFAAQCATGEWGGFTPRSIPMQGFLEQWLPGLHSAAQMCQVFPVPDDVGVVIAPPELELLVREELQQYE
ncbi:DUF2750 domain-containing protein [Pseudomonas sp. NPDC089401]|uniref:DUF2750 domain-containing protein n=1 Tax=Pseudomonas sp. NPDC089401 TaxID=3364462 RepID=UPI0037FC9F43